VTGPRPVDASFESQPDERAAGSSRASRPRPEDATSRRSTPAYNIHQADRYVRRRGRRRGFASRCTAVGAYRTFDRARPAPFVSRCSACPFCVRSSRHHGDIPSQGLEVSLNVCEVIPVAKSSRGQMVKRSRYRRMARSRSRRDRERISWRRLGPWHFLQRSWEARLA
jgi:hypothetical protein